jgi:hypothetical protein
MPSAEAAEEVLSKFKAPETRRPPIVGDNLGAGFFDAVGGDDMGDESA